MDSARTSPPDPVGTLTATRPRICSTILLFCWAVCPPWHQTRFSTGVLIPAQRLTVLVTKQAACLDI